MNYMTISDDDFLDEILKLYDNRGLASFDFLKKNPDVLKRLIKLVDSGFFKATNLSKAKSLINYFDSYDCLSKAKQMIDCPNAYSTQERSKFFLEFYSNGYSDRTKSLKFFSLADQERFSFLSSTRRYAKIDLYNYFSSFNQLSLQYIPIKTALKKILKAYFVCDNNNDKLFTYIATKLNLDMPTYSDFYEFTIALFYQTLYTGKNIAGVDIFNDFCFNDFIILNRVLNKYKNVFFLEMGYYDTARKNSIKEYEILFQLLDKMDDFLKKDNSLEHFIQYMVTDLNITFDDLEKNYIDIFKEYCKLLLNNSKNKPFTRKYDFSLALNFYNVLNLYQKMLSKYDYFVELSLSNKHSDKETMKVVFDVKYCNGITASKIKSYLNYKINCITEVNKKNKILKTIGDYQKFYLKKKEASDNLIKEKEESKNILECASLVKCYLSGDYRNLQEFFTIHGLTRNSFDRVLMMLQKNNHPIYQEYLDYSDSLRKKTFAIIISSVKTIVSLIKNGCYQANGELRKFDIIDYYGITSIPPNEMLKTVNGYISRDDYSILSKNLVCYKNDKPINGNQVNDLFNTEVSYITERDKDGNIVSQYIVKREDKEQAILLLSEAKIPLTSSTYSAMLRRYVMENIINKSKQKRL